MKSGWGVVVGLGMLMACGRSGLSEVDAGGSVDAGSSVDAGGSIDAGSPDAGAVGGGDGGFACTPESNPDHRVWSVGPAFSASGWSLASQPTLSPSTWSYSGLNGASVLKVGSTWHLWFSSFSWKIGHATSTDGVSWVADPAPVLVPTASGWESQGVAYPSVVLNAGTYFLFYGGSLNGNFRIGVATSTDGVTFSRPPNNLLIDLGPINTWTSYGAFAPSVIVENGQFTMWFAGDNVGDGRFRIGRATSTDGLQWKGDNQGPLLGMGLGGETSDAFGPSVIRVGCEYVMVYATTANNPYGPWRLVGASSPDGVKWTKLAPDPLLAPSGTWSSQSLQAPGGSLMLDGSVFRAWTTGFDGSTWRLGAMSL